MPKFRVDIPFSAVFIYESEALSQDEAISNALYELGRFIDNHTDGGDIQDPEITEVEND